MLEKQEIKVNIHSSSLDEKEKEQALFRVFDLLLGLGEPVVGPNETRNSRQDNEPRSHEKNYK